MKDVDGGYYAIKGFIYQFDKTLLEIINNKKIDVEIEQIQDIGLEGFYIQVKYKETQIYYPSKIKEPLIQLLNYFKENNNRRFCLFCYFKGQSPQRISLSLEQLDEILGTKTNNFNQDLKKKFINKFQLEFSENFNNQFNCLLKKIKKTYKLMTIEEAITYHAIFRANLLDIAIKKNRFERVINFVKINVLLAKKEKVIFESAYRKYLGNEKFISFLKKKYFTFTKLNIPRRDRLFIIGIDDLIKNNEILQVVENIKNKYYKKDTSPAPYVCLVGLTSERIMIIKQYMWDKGLRFTDGTHFDGDKFRLTDLTEDTYNKNHGTPVKILTDKDLLALIKYKNIDERFALLTDKQRNQELLIKDIKTFYIDQTKSIIKIIN